MEPSLDHWLPEPQVRTRHRTVARATPDGLWHAAETVSVCQAPVLGRLVRWRIPGTPRDLAYRDLFSRYPFTVLDEGEHCLTSGLCGRIWTVQRDYPQLQSAEEFLAWDRPGTVRVLFAHWIEPAGNGESAIVSESRVKPVDRRAGMRLRALWALVGGFERLIGGEALRLVARRAESG